MDNQKPKESLDNMIEFLSQIENKEQTLVEFLNDFIEKKVSNAQIHTEKLIQQEIEQNILLLENLKKYFNQ